MRAKFNHPWDLSPSEAVKLQKELALKVELTRPNAHFRYIAGIDCAPSADKTKYYSAVVIWDRMRREIIEYHISEAPLKFPYIPGLLSFREIPAIIEVMKKLQSEPDLLIVDGHGIAHPRAFGIACHVGVLFDKPAFGCGKSLLYGHYHEPHLKRGSTEPLTAKDQTIGNVVRTRDKVKPVFVSVGHKMDLETVTNLVLECSGKYRLPEPTHLADKLVAQKQAKSFIYPPAPQLELPENYSALSL